ncbi:hypothetical protein Trydic_g20213 [Trypoxylus dichotomus]
MSLYYPIFLHISFMYSIKHLLLSTTKRTSPSKKSHSAINESFQTWKYRPSDSTFSMASPNGKSTEINIRDEKRGGWSSRKTTTIGATPKNKKTKKIFVEW